MHKLIRSRLYLAMAVFSLPSAGAAEESSHPNISEPVMCYRLVGAVDSGMTVGLGVELCSGTTNAIATLSCFREAFGAIKDGGLGLNRGLAVQLCKTAGGSSK